MLHNDCFSCKQQSSQRVLRIFQLHRQKGGNILRQGKIRRYECYVCYECYVMPSLNSFFEYMQVIHLIKSSEELCSNFVNRIGWNVKETKEQLKCFDVTY